MELRAIFLLLFLTAVRGFISRKGAQMRVDKWRPNPDLYNHKPFKVEIDLDLPPEERWNDVARVHHAQIVHLAQHCPELRLAYGGDRVDRWLNVQEIPEDYKREMRGFVQAVNDSSLTYECVVMQNLFYETDLSSEGCSGVLAAMPNGTVIHARNVDWGHEYGHNAAGALETTFTRGGKPIFVSATQLFLFGMHSSMLFGGWSFEQNTRREGLNAEADLAWAEKGGQSFGFMARKFMEDGLSYAQAVEKFSTTKWNSPQYFIVAGAGAYEGAVITIDPAVSFQNVEVLNTRNRKILYQLNKDSWLAKDEDRDIPAMEFQNLAQKEDVPIDEHTVWNLIKTEPLYNDDNVLTFEAIPATGYWKFVLHPEGTLAQAYKKEKDNAASLLLRESGRKEPLQAKIIGNGEIAMER